MEQKIYPIIPNFKIYPTTYEVGDIQTKRILKNEYEAYKRLSYEGLVDKQICVPKKYTEEEIAEMKKPAKEHHVNLTRKPAREKNNGLFDLNDLFI